MIALISDNLPELNRLCREFGVRRLEIFGSAATGEFNQESSDIDFIIEFNEGTPRSFSHLFAFEKAAGRLLGRRVDLVMNAEFKNPYFREAVNESRELIYESTNREIAV